MFASAQGPKWGATEASFSGRGQRTGTGRRCLSFGALLRRATFYPCAANLGGPVVELPRNGEQGSEFLQDPLRVPDKHWHQR